MRKITTALLSLGVAAMLASPAFATTLISESFSYPDGNLVGNGGWLNYSGTGTDIQVASGRAVGTSLSAPDDHKLFAPQALTDKTYACFLVKIPAVAGAPKPVYFAELKDGAATLIVARVYVLPISGGFTFGISYSSTSTLVGVTPWSASTLSYDTDYTIAIRYSPTDSTATLWVDPATEASTSVTNKGVVGPIAVSGFGLRESGTASTLPPSPAYVGTVDWGYSVDNLGVGTTFIDACNSGPTPANKSTWGQLKTIYRN